MPLSAENNQVLLPSQSAYSECSANSTICVSRVQITSTTNSPVGISFVVDTGKLVAVHVEGSRSDLAKLQGPESGGDSPYGLLSVYAQIDAVLESVE